MSWFNTMRLKKSLKMRVKLKKKLSKTKVFKWKSYLSVFLSWNFPLFSDDLNESNFVYTLSAPTSGFARQNEGTRTYLNKDQVEKEFTLMWWNTIFKTVIIFPFSAICSFVWVRTQILTRYFYINFCLIVKAFYLVLFYWRIHSTNKILNQSSVFHWWPKRGSLCQ